LIPLRSLLFLPVALSLCSAVGFLPRLAFADAIVRSNAMQATTIVEYFIETDRILVDLEIGGSDLALFRNLMPDEIYERMGNAPRPLAERLAEFFTRDLPIAGPEGALLPGVVQEIGSGERIRRDAVTGEPLPAEEGEAEMVVRARLLYRFDGRPEQLAFSAPGGVSVGFIVYHLGVAVNDFRYLSPGIVLDLDWIDPWYSSFRSRSLRRQYFAPMSGFIYVEPYEVRKEIIVRPLDLQRFVDLGLEGRETIPVEIQAELKRRAAEFLREHHPVEIDGVAVPGELARIHFLERSLRTSRVIDPPEELSVYSAVLGVIFVYPTDGLPQRVTMEWDLWYDRLTSVPASAVDQAGPLPTFLDPDWRVLEWKNFLKNPELPTLIDVRPPPTALQRGAVSLRWIALLLLLVAVIRLRESPRSRVPAVVATALITGVAFWLARGASIDQARGREVVGALLHNVYRAFDYRDEEQIYDVLAHSADGDLLEQIYLETRRGLVLASQGGARAKVKAIELAELQAEPADDGAFVADITWNVAGSVGHWGHVHQRRNRVRAELLIAPIDGSWKLIEMKVLEEERL
jgi:hypothetical protein